MPLLFKALRCGDEAARKVARETIPAFGLDPDDPVPALIERLRDPSWWECTHERHPWLGWWISPGRVWQGIHPAARALMELGPEVLPALTADLLARNWPENPHHMAVLVYLRLGEASLPFLEELARAHHREVQDAIESVRATPGEALVPVK